MINKEIDGEKRSIQVDVVRIWIVIELLVTAKELIFRFSWKSIGRRFISIIERLRSDRIVKLMIVQESFIKFQVFFHLTELDQFLLLLVITSSLFDNFTFVSRLFFNFVIIVFTINVLFGFLLFLTLPDKVMKLRLWTLDFQLYIH